MVLSIKSPRADQLARDLAALTGESITEAVVASLEARLELERRSRSEGDLSDIIDRFRLVELLDERKPDEILGYDSDGLAS